MITNEFPNIFFNLQTEANGEDNSRIHLFFAALPCLAVELNRIKERVSHKEQCNCRMLFSDSDSNINCNTGWSIETLKCRPRTDKISLDAFGYVHSTQLLTNMSSIQPDKDRNQDYE